MDCGDVVIILVIAANVSIFDKVKKLNFVSVSKKSGVDGEDLQLNIREDSCNYFIRNKGLMTIVELVPEQISELSLIICHKFLEKLLLKIRWQFLEVFTFSDSYEIMFVIIDYHRLCKVRIFKWSILTVSLNLTKRH